MRRGEREDEGIYDRGSTFDRGEERTGDASNPVIERQEDPARGVPAAELAQGRNAAPIISNDQLVAVWDQNGNPQVARVVNHRQQGHFHPPTKEEWEALRARGQLVKGGLSDAPAAAPAAPAGDSKGFPWGKAVAVLGVLGALWAWKNWDTVQDWADDMFGGDGEPDEIEEA